MSASTLNGNRVTKVFPRPSPIGISCKNFCSLALDARLAAVWPQWCSTTGIIAKYIYSFAQLCRNHTQPLLYHLHLHFHLRQLVIHLRQKPSPFWSTSPLILLYTMGMHGVSWLPQWQKRRKLGLWPLSLRKHLHWMLNHRWSNYEGMCRDSVKYFQIYQDT